MIFCNQCLNNMNPKISVIIPVYGVEKYLDRCVDSVVKQSYKNLEIILVDDGSPDNCPKMCDDWALRDVRIRTVHRENGGLSCARNTGLSVATGDYITFIDSDDWIALDTYDYCINLVQKYPETDVVQFENIYATIKNTKVPSRLEIVEAYYKKEALKHYMECSTRDSGVYSVCSCLFKAAIAKRYCFREGKIYEDMDYKFKVLKDSECWVISNQVKYFYWQEGDSTSSGKIKARDLQLYDGADELYKLCLQEKNAKIIYYGQIKKARTPFSLLCRIALWGVDESSLNKKEITERLLKEHRNNLSILLKAPIPMSRKIISVLMAINFRLTQRIMVMSKSFANL